MGWCLGAGFFFFLGGGFCLATVCVVVGGDGCY